VLSRKSASVTVNGKMGEPQRRKGAKQEGIRSKLRFSFWVSSPFILTHSKYLVYTLFRKFISEFRVSACPRARCGFAWKMRSALVMFFLGVLELCGEVEKTSIRGVTLPSLSADGRMVVFKWMNDLWVGSSDGGDARRLVKHPADDTKGIFTRDGKRVVFGSTRSGSHQIYSVSLKGDDLVQHTDHSQGYYLEGISADGKYAYSRGYRGASGTDAYRLLKTDLGDKSRELELFDATAHSASYSEDGMRILFCRGGEQTFRKGYRGSRASEIHLYDVGTGEFEVLIDEEWEAREPIWIPDGKGFYYLSNKEGVFNVWRRIIADGKDEQLTHFKDDAVVYPSLSADGKWMVFVVGTGLHRFSTETGKVEELDLHTVEELKRDEIRTERVKGTSSVAFVEGGKRIVFSAAGDLWTMLEGEAEVKRLTESDKTDERELVMSGGSKIYYLSDDGVVCRVVERDFVDGEFGKEVVIPAGKRSKRKLRMSPDGRSLSWLEATGDLVTYRLGGKAARVVMPCWDIPTYDWSPDGRWLVVAAKDIHSNRDIWLVAANGEMEPMNLTMHPSFEGSPKWSPDGRKIVFTARRGVDGLASLWMFEVDDLLSGDGSSDEAVGKIAASLQAVETDVSESMRVMWSMDSKELLFQSRDAGDGWVYALRLYDGKVREFAEFRGSPVQMVSKELSMWLVDGVPSLYDEKKMRSFDFSFPVSQQRSERQRLAFRKIWRMMKERFYDENMAGVDWNMMRKRLEDEAAGARDSWQYDRVVARLLGELNASHLTFNTRLWGSLAKKVEVKNPTAHSGLVFSNSWEGDLLIERVVVGSPISKVESPPVAGEIVRRIGGRDVDARTSLEEMFHGAKGRTLPMVVENAAGKKRTLDLTPASYTRIRYLERKAREAEARRLAGENGFVYLPFRRMKASDLENLSVEVYRASLGAKGIILDLRDNAGGRVADELLALFCQPVHTFTLPRGGPRGYPQDRRVTQSWDGPLVVLCNQNTYSNAEIFCHAFKRLGRGKLVGMPTNGGVISAVSVQIPELGDLQVPFRGWFDVDTGVDLDLNGAVPDVKVPMLPSDEAAGHDSQLAAALEVLKKEISEEKEEVEPRYKGMPGEERGDEK
jgi:tricorn protease